jgi:hypothetical protein
MKQIFDRFSVVDVAAEHEVEADHTGSPMADSSALLDKRTDLVRR